MTPAQRTMARHALGLKDGRKVSYRNRYSASIGSREWRRWVSMVAEGLARKYAEGIVLQHFELTAAGAVLALAAGESLDLEDFPEAEGSAVRMREVGDADERAARSGARDEPNLPYPLTETPRSTGKGEDHD